MSYTLTEHAKKVLAEEQFALFKEMVDLGDIIGVSGKLFTTHAGELTVRVESFTVLSKSSLVIPPDFNLRPPPPGIASRNDPDADETGGALALPSASAASLGAAYSDGEKLLLTKTNALAVDANIRKTITIDVGLEDQGPGFAQKVLFQGADAPKPAAETPATSATPAAPAAAIPAAPPPASMP
jgi:hypothetical protein